jgi:pimeloyl-[acyl-carrier protein] methyl ester esterase
MVDMRPLPRSALVLLPGLDGTGAMFSRFRRALDPAIRTIVVSYPPDEVVGYPGLEGLVRALLPRNDPFVLLAESFSGPIGISIAASRPDGLRGLILVSSFARNPRPRLAPLRPLVRLLPIHPVPAAWLTRHALGRFATAELRSELLEALSRVSPSVVRGRLRAILDVDASALLPQIDVPVLYLQASADRVVPRSASPVLESVPQIRFVEVEGPHFLLQASPSAAARHVEAFLRLVATP